MNDTNPLAESLRLLWDGLPEREKGPRRSLTLTQIVTAAVDLADDAGADALSMRALAQKLGVGTMSLYRYIPSKTELLNLMLDSVVGPTPSRDKARHQGWRTFLTTTAQEARRMYLAHPWALQANWSRPVLGPNSLADLELFMSGVRDLPLSDREKMNLATTLDSYVLGTARQEVLWMSAATETDMTDDEFWAHQAPTLSSAMQSGTFPTLTTLDEHAFDANWEENFTFGLDLLLDGVARLVERPDSH